TNVPAILGFIAGGLTYVAAATGVIPKEFALLGVALPFIGLGVGEILNRAHATEVTPFGTPPEGPVASNLGEKLPGDTPFLQRIFEEGPNGFRIADIGQGATDTGTSAPSLAASIRTLATTAGLRQFLDDLDDTPNNVTLTEANGVTRYDVRIKKTLSGTAGFGVDALDGKIDLAGDVEASVDVTVHLIFALDH